MVWLSPARLVADCMDQGLRLSRLGAQNSRMATTAGGMLRWASKRANWVSGPSGGAPGTGRPFGPVQCARMGSAKGACVSG